MSVNWNDLDSMISENFSLHEALYLPHWVRCATEADGLNEEIENSLFALFQKMEEIRDLMNAPLIIHCAYRPPEYSVLVGGSLDDVHTKGMAADFHVYGLPSGEDCDKVRQVILPSLESLGMRMEDNPGGAWIHLDIHPVINNRFFKP